MAKNILDQGKGLVEKAKREAAEVAISQALNLLGHSSEKNYVRLASVLEKVAGDNLEQQAIASWVKRWVTDGPGGPYLQRILKNTHPKMRKDFVAKLLVGVFFRPEDVWKRLQEQEGVAPPTTLVISPTMRCNFACTGCYAGNYTKADDMPPEMFDKVITQGKELGMRFFTVSGGEPLIYPTLLETFKKHNDCAFQFFTNGSLITDEVCEQLLELGNVSPCISIEGNREFTDERRGKGAYDHVMAAMDRLRKNGIVFAFSATATSKNVSFITSDEFIDQMIEKGAYYGWYFSYIPIGKGPNLDYMPTPEQRNQLRQGVKRVRTTKPILLADFWNDGAMTGGCISAGRIFFHVNHRGDMEPCVFCHFATHNLKNSTLLDALKSPFFTAIRSKQPFNHNLLKPCPLIDNPKVMRWAVNTFGAYPTHAGAESLVNDLADGLDKYSDDLGKLYHGVWQNEYSQWANKWAEGLWGERYAELNETGDPDKIPDNIDP